MAPWAISALKTMQGTMVHADEDSRPPGLRLLVTVTVNAAASADSEGFTKFTCPKWDGPLLLSDLLRLKSKGLKGKSGREQGRRSYYREISGRVRSVDLF